MDYKTQLVTGILCSVTGIYLLIIGYKSTVLRRSVLIFPVQFGIWLNRLTNGEEAAEKLKNEKLEPKFLFYTGISYLFTGTIALILGILLLILL